MSNNSAQVEECPVQGQEKEETMNHIEGEQSPQSGDACAAEPEAAIDNTNVTPSLDPETVQMEKEPSGKGEASSNQDSPNKAKEPSEKEESSSDQDSPKKEKGPSDKGESCSEKCEKATEEAHDLTTSNDESHTSDEEAPKQQEPVLHPVHEPETPTAEHDHDEDNEYSYSYSYSESEEEAVHTPKAPKSGAPSALRNTARLRQLQAAEKLRNMDGQMQRLRQLALDLEPIDGYNDEVYEDLREILVEERRQRASENKLAESETLTQAINHVEETQEWHRKLNLQAEAMEDYQLQARQLQDEIDSFDDMTKKKIDELKQRTMEQRQRLVNSHEMQLDRHTKRWTSDAKVRQYSHATNQLVFLRKQFKLLMTQCRFKEADEVRAIIEKTEKAEQAEAHKLMQHDFDESLSKLQQKHREELSFFETQSSIKMKQLQQQRARERIQYMNKKKKMQRIEKNIADPDKLWNLRKNQRIEELSCGATVRGTTARTKININDIQAKNDKEENIITLPPLNLRRNPRTTR